MWKLLFQSVRGPAHLRGGQPCQDYCLVRLRRFSHGQVLILACADGAGSAPFADLGARLACQGVLEAVSHTLIETPTSEIQRGVVQAWLAEVRDNLETAATLHQVPVHQFATTLLVAVVGETAALFAQVGDGVMVVNDGDAYRPVFWPQSGEYANSTNFLTDVAALDLLDFAPHTGRLDEVALLTDGLQGLALNLSARNVHAPFFRPMFARLRAAHPGDNLPRALRRFLDSSAVNARSDDDKTLILATRVPPSAITPAS